MQSRVIYLLASLLCVARGTSIEHQVPGTEVRGLNPMGPLTSMHSRFVQEGEPERPGSQPYLGDSEQVLRTCLDLTEFPHFILFYFYYYFLVTGLNPGELSHQAISPTLFDIFLETGSL